MAKPSEIKDVSISVRGLGFKVGTQILALGLLGSFIHEFQGYWGNVGSDQTNLGQNFFPKVRSSLDHMIRKPMIEADEQTKTTQCVDCQKLLTFLQLL